MAWTVLERKLDQTLLLTPGSKFRRYNGTSDLQLERMNVYFNEVCFTIQEIYATAKLH